MKNNLLYVYNRFYVHFTGNLQYSTVWLYMSTSSYTFIFNANVQHPQVNSYFLNILNTYQCLPCLINIVNKGFIFICYSVFVQCVREYKRDFVVLESWNYLLSNIVCLPLQLSTKLWVDVKSKQTGPRQQCLTAVPFLAFSLLGIPAVWCHRSENLHVSFRSRGTTTDFKPFAYKNTLNQLACINV